MKRLKSTAIFTLCLSLLLGAVPLAAQTTPVGGACRIPAMEYPVGTLSIDNLLDNYPVFFEGYDSYQVSDNESGYFQAVDEPIELLIFFAVWCSDSQIHVPNLIKSLDAAENDNIKARFYALDTDKRDPFDYAEIHQIKWVPTIIVFRDNHEIGRIVETPEESLGKDLQAILNNREKSSLCKGNC